MSEQLEGSYGFVDALPLEPMDPGTNVLVTEPKVGGRHQVAPSLLIGADYEATVFVTTENTGREMIDLFEDCGGRYMKNRMAVIDCSEGGRESAPLNIRTVSSPADLTGIGMEFSSLYDQLLGSEIGWVRTGFHGLSPLLLYTEDFRTVYRFVNTATGRINVADGLGIFTLDPETQESQTVRSLAEIFDGNIEIRTIDDGEYELRVRGLEDQPTDWVQFSLDAL